MVRFDPAAFEDEIPAVDPRGEAPGALRAD
jgi:hypothetical protein